MRLMLVLGWLMVAVGCHRGIRSDGTYVADVWALTTVESRDGPPLEELKLFQEKRACGLALQTAAAEYGPSHPGMKFKCFKRQHVYKVKQVTE